MTIGKGVTLIVLATIISFFLSISIDMKDLGLGGLFNIALPPVLGIAGIILFLLTCWISKKEFVRIIATVLIIAYLIYTGWVFHFRPDYLPIPFD
jgi:hypothetical protein